MGGYPPEEGLPEHYRAFRLMRLFGWTLDEYEATPAAFCDWALRLEAVEDEARAEAQKGASRG